MTQPRETTPSSHQRQRCADRDSNVPSLSRSTGLCREDTICHDRSRSVTIGPLTRCKRSPWITARPSAGTSTPPSIAATPVPALPQPIAVSGYTSAVAPPNVQSATEALYANGVHAYQGTAGVGSGAEPHIPPFCIDHRLLISYATARASFNADEMKRRSVLMRIKRFTDDVFVPQLRVLCWTPCSKRTQACSTTQVRLARRSLDRCDAVAVRGQFH